MDFLNFSLGGELSTPVGQAVERATLDTMREPDWSQNLEICDMVNSNPEGPEQAARALRKRIKHDKESVVRLSLTIVETCVKNCGVNFHRAIATREFMDELTPLAVGRKGPRLQEETLRLIQQWALAFKQRSGPFGIFTETYQQMKAQGLPFSSVDEHDVPVIDQPTSQSSAGSYGAAAATSGRQSPPHANTSQDLSSEEELARLDGDLDSVMEKVKLCREMLPESPGIQADEALADVIGFLEACRDRMVDLIEAGTQGLLGETLLEKALKVNDALLRTLEAEKTGKHSFEDDLGSPTGKPASTTGDLLDLDGPTSSSAQGVRSPPTRLQGAEADDDEFSSLSLKTSRKVGQKGRGVAPAAASTPLAVPTPAQNAVASPTAAPTPFNSVQSQQPSADMFASSTDIDLLFGSTTPSAASNTVAPATTTTTTTTSTTAPGPTTTNTATTSTLMSDDEFENFLNSMATPQRS